jgi:tetratricopeptide (TPR) repeat protein
MSSMYRIFLGYALFIVCVRTVSGQGLDLTPTEQAALPEYCTYSMFVPQDRQVALADHPRKKYWDSVNGPDMIHIHHLCNAHVLASRATRTRDLTRAKYLHERTVNELAYVLRNLIDPKYRLLAEIHTMQGVSLVALKKYADAEVAFERAVLANPTYVKAYGHAAESRLSQKQVPAAREWAEKGLKVDPNNTWLAEIMKISLK